MHLIYLINLIRLNQFYLKHFPDPNESQKEAINNSLNQTISTILGPPGTGKSQTIAALLNEFLERSKNQTPNKPVRILISAFSYNAMFVIIDMLTNHQNNNGDPSSISKLIDISLLEIEIMIILTVSSLIIRQLNYNSITLMMNKLDYLQITKLWKITYQKISYFWECTSIKKLAQLNKEEPGMKAFKSNFGFDLIIIDEASQYPTDHILSILPFLYQNQYQVRIDKELNIQSPNLINDVEHQNHKFSKLILVGDHNQLPPVQPIKPPKRLENILGSIYSYYVSNHKINQVQLKMNYRSNEIINGITQNLGFYELIDTFNQNLGNSIIVDKSYNTPINSIIF